MSSHAAVRARPAAADRISAALQALGAVLLGVEGGVHVQQHVEIVHTVAWIGPLFALNAAACAVTVAALLMRRTRTVASGAGIVISAGALVALALSYTVGLFGWIEVGLRPPVEIAIASEVGAIVALAGALIASRAGSR